MLKENLDVKELLETIEKEMEQWSSYYFSNNEITNMQIKNILKIKEAIKPEELQKRVDKCKDKAKLEEINKAIQVGKYAGFEAQIALRTLTWVRNLMIENQNTKEGE